jgi:uncharacterized membrane protein YoaK (UPF0700 family)
MADATTARRRLVRVDATLALLTFVSSITDVLSFLALSRVFTSGMTGNTALLGLAVGQGQMFTASHAASALAGFVLALACGTLLSRTASHQVGLVGLLALEALCLGAFCVIWFGFEHAAGSTAIYLLIALSAMGMGIQAVAARRINVPGIPTVVFTTTLTNIVMATTDAVARRVPLSFDTKRMIGIFSIYIAGATLAGALASRHLDVLAVLPLIAVLSALAIEYGSKAVRSDSG